MSKSESIVRYMNLPPEVALWCHYFSESIKIPKTLLSGPYGVLFTYCSKLPAISYSDKEIREQIKQCKSIENVDKCLAEYFHLDDPLTKEWLSIGHIAFQVKMSEINDKSLQPVIILMFRLLSAVSYQFHNELNEALKLKGNHLLWSMFGYIFEFFARISDKHFPDFSLLMNVIFTEFLSHMGVIFTLPSNHPLIQSLNLIIKHLVKFIPIEMKIKQYTFYKFCQTVLSIAIAKLNDITPFFEAISAYVDTIRSNLSTTPPDSPIITTFPKFLNSVFSIFSQKIPPSFDELGCFALETLKPEMLSPSGFVTFLTWYSNTFSPKLTLSLPDISQSIINVPEDTKPISTLMNSQVRIISKLISEYSVPTLLQSNAQFIQVSKHFHRFSSISLNDFFPEFEHALQVTTASPSRQYLLALICLFIHENELNFQLDENKSKAFFTELFDTYLFSFPWQQIKGSIDALFCHQLYKNLLLTLNQIYVKLPSSNPLILNSISSVLNNATVLNILPFLNHLTDYLHYSAKFTELLGECKLFDKLSQILVSNHNTIIGTQIYRFFQYHFIINPSVMCSSPFLILLKEIDNLDRYHPTLIDTIKKWNMTAQSSPVLIPKLLTIYSYIFERKDLNEKTYILFLELTLNLFKNLNSCNGTPPVQLPFLLLLSKLPLHLQTSASLISVFNCYFQYFEKFPFQRFILSDKELHSNTVQALHIISAEEASKFTDLNDGQSLSIPNALTELLFIQKDIVFGSMQLIRNYHVIPLFYEIPNFSQKATDFFTKLVEYNETNGYMFVQSGLFYNLLTGHNHNFIAAMLKNSFNPTMSISLFKHLQSLNQESIELQERDQKETLNQQNVSKDNLKSPSIKFDENNFIIKKIEETSDELLEFKKQKKFRLKDNQLYFYDGKIDGPTIPLSLIPEEWSFHAKIKICDKSIFTVLTLGTVTNLIIEDFTIKVMAFSEQQQNIYSFDSPPLQPNKWADLNLYITSDSTSIKLDSSPQQFKIPISLNNSLLTFLHSTTENPDVSFTLGMGNGYITEIQFNGIPVTYDFEKAYKENNGLIPCTFKKQVSTLETNATNQSNSFEKGEASFSGLLASTMSSIIGTFHSPEVWTIFFKLNDFSLVHKLLQYSDDNELAFIKADGVEHVKSRILLIISELKFRANNNQEIINEEIDLNQSENYDNNNTDNITDDENSNVNDNYKTHDKYNKKKKTHKSKNKKSKDHNDGNDIENTEISFIQKIKKLTDEELEKEIIDLLNIYIYLSSGGGRFISSILLNLKVIASFPKSIHYFEEILPKLFEIKPVDFVSVLHKHHLMINLIKESSLLLPKDSLQILMKIIKETSKQTTSVDFFSDLISCLLDKDCRPFYEVILDIFTEELTILKQGTINAFLQNEGFKPLFTFFCNPRNSYLHLSILKCVFTLAWSNESIHQELTPTILQLLPTIIQLFPKKTDASKSETKPNGSILQENLDSDENSIPFPQELSMKSSEYDFISDVILSEDQKVELRKFLAPSLISDVFHLISDPFKFTPSFIPLLAFISFIYKGTSDNLDEKLAENWALLGELLQESNNAAALTEVPYWVYWLMILCQASFKTDDNIAPMIGYIIAIILSANCRKGNEKPLCELFSSLNSISTLHNIDPTQTKIKVLTRVFKDWPNSAMNPLFLITFSALFIHFFKNNDQIIITDPIFDINVMNQLERDKNISLISSPPSNHIKLKNIGKSKSSSSRRASDDILQNNSLHPPIKPVLKEGISTRSIAFIKPITQLTASDSNIPQNFNAHPNQIFNPNRHPHHSEDNDGEQVMDYTFKIRTTEDNVWRDSELALILVDGILIQGCDHINEQVAFTQYLSVSKIQMAAYVLSMLILTKSITPDIINQKIGLLVDGLMKVDQFDAHVAAGLILAIPKITETIQSNYVEKLNEIFNVFTDPLDSPQLQKFQFESKLLYNQDSIYSPNFRIIFLNTI